MTSIVFWRKQRNITIEGGALTDNRTLVIPDKNGTIVTTGHTNLIDSNMMKSTVQLQFLNSNEEIITRIYGAGE
jgi:hypothetical protein